MKELPASTTVRRALAALDLEVKAVSATRNGRRSKAILFLGPPGGRLRGVLKLPLFPEGGEALRDELRALTDLALVTGVDRHLPTVVWRSTSPEQPPLFVLTFERGASLRAEARARRGLRRSRLERIRAFLAALHDGRGEPRPASPDALLSRIVAAAPDRARSFEAASRLLADRDFERGYIHGDFVPKNVLFDRSDRLKVLDWEYATSGGHRMLDVLDMALQLVSDDPRMATFQVLQEVWSEESGLDRLVAMLRRLRPAAADEFHSAGPRAASLLYLQWCAWRFARARRSGPVGQVAGVVDRLLARDRP